MSAILALETGQVFPGVSIGVSGMCVGEVVFNTSLTGYQETLTDPSYAQQIITFTYPHIGNTGINPEDFQSLKIHAAGMIIKKLSPYVSSWRATQSLQEFLQQQQTVAIADVDTRSLTKILRNHGSLRGCIMAGEINEQQAIQSAKNFSAMQGKDLLMRVTNTHAEVTGINNTLHVALLDFGVKDNIKQYLLNLGCKVTVFPHDTSAEIILAAKPHGVLLSNGPGDPQACTEVIATIKILLQSDLPIFGICLGHQLLALALDAKTYKMTFGHHGTNHPVQDLRSKQVMITSQNHGYAVVEESLASDFIVTHRSLFDQSVQGFKHMHLPVFGFQGHPEAAPGPHDIAGLFDDFISAIRTHNAQKT